MAKRFRKHGHAFFEFITTPNIDPTDNSAEQAIRFDILDRKVTQSCRVSRRINIRYGLPLQIAEIRRTLLSLDP
jgi:hypothetical protein